jgi:predicted metalloprotease with PDZ domain
MIRYRISFSDRRHHAVDVTGWIPAGGADTLELVLPVWAPGSYLVRDFARNVERLTAEDGGGGPLAVEKSAKHRWRIRFGGAREARVDWRVYARRMSVQECFVDGELAILHLAALLPAVAGREREPLRLEVETPPEWARLEVPLERLPGEPAAFLAPDYDALLDAPVYAGNGEARDFEAGGIPHRVIDDGGAGLWDGERAASDLAAIAAEEQRLWGVVPYRRYLFVNLLHGDGGSGLEHRDSTVLLTDPFRTRSRKAYLGWLGLAAHELFHAWNVKRLRPVELGPFDYERENYTRSLWVAEGVTSYYDDLLVRRAGLATDEEYLRFLSEHLEKHETRPGREVQPLADASFDTWIRFYRPDETTANTQVSYYVKGALVAWLLDVEIRRASGDERSLDDLLRALWARYSGERGFAEEELRALAAELAGRDLATFFRDAVDGIAPLDYAPALDWFGLRLAPVEETPEAGETKPKKGWLGARFDAGALTLAEVRRDGPAWEAGLSPGDELVAIDGLRVRPDGLEARLEAYPPGTAARLLVARRLRMTELPVVFGAEPPARFKLEADPAATAGQLARRQAWLAPSRSAVPAPVA